jgi:hypothetical protein
LGRYEDAAQDFLTVIERDHKRRFQYVFTGLARVLQDKEDAVPGGWVNTGFVWRVADSHHRELALKPPLPPAAEDDLSDSDKDELETKKDHDYLLEDEALDESLDDDLVFAVKTEYNARNYVLPSTSRHSTTSRHASGGGRPGIYIEQVCLHTGKLLQRFDSVSEAAKLTGFVYSQLRASMGQVFNGLFWRLGGSRALPTHLFDEEPNPANILLRHPQKRMRARPTQCRGLRWT